MVSYAVLPDFLNSVAFWKISELRPFFVLARATFNCMEHWWKDTDAAKSKYSEKYLSQCPWAHHKSHMD
jgi:hypothetical protein